ncbi:MAG: dihydrofolate reductase [Bacteroidales bacterium]|nr:dihydrofolate reductase [Bacteroidales bacterium]
MNKFIISIASMAILTTSCTDTTKTSEFDYNVDRFADIEVLRYKVPGFEELSLNQKKLIYFLNEAALHGRDIMFDQNGKYNLAVRQTLEAIYTNFTGDKDSAEFKAFEKYLKQVWFGNGIHHHYSTDKFVPEFSAEFFAEQVKDLPAEVLSQSADEIIATLSPVIFDPTVTPKRVNQAQGQDLILTSAANLYEGVTQQEVEDYYNKLKDPNDPTPISYGLNTKLVKIDGKIVELPYKIGGLYGEAIENIVFWLKKAEEVAENDAQKAHIEKLINFYETGDLKTFDEYSILWAQDTLSQVDFVNGFIESYGDPLGMKGAWESLVNFKNLDASRRTEIISENAQWFEDNSPVDSKFKKETVKGVSAKVITAAILAGDCYPSTPIGINLPNANWIRANYGSKSVTIENITDAYDEAAKGNGFNQEFAYSEVEIESMNKYLSLTDKLHTDLHECLGHGSGKLLPGVDPDALKAYGSTIEETRADLFALYYLADEKLIEIGILDNPEAYKSEYYKYILNGYMTQLTRIEPGKDVEESHMRNRKLIAEWAYKHGKEDNVIELVKRDGKTFIKINDYTKLRNLFGQLLAEIQRIKSEGDYDAAMKLVEEYAVKVDPEIHKEVLERYASLNIAPYKGFVNPIYTVVTDENGNITDVKIDYTENYVDQMLRYSRDYSHLTK